MITKKNRKISFYFFVFLIFTTNTHFFNDLYNLFYRHHEERMIRTYGYCSGISYGFIKKIKSQFLQFEKKVVIINPIQMSFEFEPQISSLGHAIALKLKMLNHRH